MLENIYNVPENKDIIFRSIIPASPSIKAVLIFIDGLVDKKVINLTILQPLMLMGSADRQIYDSQTAAKLITEYLPSNQVHLSQNMQAVSQHINLGDTAIFLAGVQEAIIVEAKGQEHRSIDRPALEQSIRAGQAAFTETLRVNTGLIRSLIRASDIITDISAVGKHSNTPCAIMYLKSIANPSLVKEAKCRLAIIDVDSITSVSMLNQYLIDNPMLIPPQTLVTERPDRVAAALSEGRLAILLDGSPFAIIAPISLFTLFHSADDFSFSWVAASFICILRIAGTFITLFLPAVYIAATYFHTEAIPTELILAIAGARERVPFPSLVEVLLMELPLSY